ncbi:twin-arginine translocase TatA/TatE family subunit [Georgenia sp. 10Sc9-8]|uniref:Twin-arginine translocase TatA/TatE family subunit n=1 Tax=Georgenia halotolerans TaxID=3028317 RepID=A0ABT5TVL2_9MICO|nr:twin-arginine translocase TatA/TatE family subunit [Georgenia halotolerans]
MAGINGWELMVLLLVALLVIGPERLPQAAEQLARVARELRRVATGARERVREELGPEVADIDLAKLDPRQYDPRRIVREALMEDVTGPTTPAARPPAPSGGSLANPAGVVARAQQRAGAATAGAATAGATAAAAGAVPAAGEGPDATGHAGAGEPAPPAVVFDDEAT